MFVAILQVLKCGMSPVNVHAMGVLSTPSMTKQAMTERKKVVQLKPDLTGLVATALVVYHIVGIIHGGLIYVVFAIDKHPQKFNQRIIKIVNQEDICTVPHMTLLQ